MVYVTKHTYVVFESRQKWIHITDSNAYVSISSEEINRVKLGYSCLLSIDDKECFLLMPIAIHSIYSLDQYDHYGWALERLLEVVEVVYSPLQLYLAEVAEVS